MDKNILALVFAGSRTATLTILEEERTNAAIPFGGNYRIIDFALSNLSNSDIKNVGVITQYRPTSLIEHLDYGRPWDFIGRNKKLKVLPPYTDINNTAWYKGTADAIYRNIDFIEEINPSYILFLSGDDVYKFNFDDLYNYALRKNADAVIVGGELNLSDMSRFGIIEVDDEMLVKNFEEKPKNPKTNIVYQSISLFKKDVLLDAIKNDAKNNNSNHNFSLDILPFIIKTKSVYMYKNNNPWHYIGNIFEFWETNMKILNNFEINPEVWGIRTNLNDRNICYRKPVIISENAKITNSVISKGAEIDGIVENSIIFPGVKIAKNAFIKDSIIMHDTIINKNSKIYMSIIDKDAVISENVEIGIGENIPNQRYPDLYYKGISIIGKNSEIPKNTIVGKNCLIYENIKKSQFTDNLIPSGMNIYY